MKRPDQKSRGFTLIELVVVMVIVVVLAVTMLDRVWLYQEQAEKAAMVEVVGVIQSELLMKYGHLMIRGTEAEIAALSVDNPMTWLAKTPLNYVGELYDPLPDSGNSGNWVFDLKSRELIYLIARTDHFTSAEDGQKWIRYRVRLMVAPSSDVPDKSIVGVLFEPVKPYKWFE
jgi:prepilin-type N-terminal cleavage/methylation domain-containing protein